MSYNPPPEVIVEAMQSVIVRDALRAKAEQVAASHDQIAQSEGSSNRAVVESGTRPQGRPYSNVVVPNGAAEEWGDSKTERRRRLGRASDTNQG